MFLTGSYFRSTAWEQKLTGGYSTVNWSLCWRIKLKLRNIIVAKKEVWENKQTNMIIMLGLLILGHQSFSSNSSTFFLKGHQSWHSKKKWQSSFIWNAITVALTKCTVGAQLAKQCYRWCRRWGCGRGESWRDRQRGTGARCYQDATPCKVNTQLCDFEL